jgi:hypothetical protein
MPFFGLAYSIAELKEVLHFQFPVITEYSGLYLHLDSIKTNPTYNTDGAMKNTAPGLTNIKNNSSLIDFLKIQ